MTMKHFLKATSILVILPFYVAFYSLSKKPLDAKTLLIYNLFTPFWFGTWNTILYYLSSKYNWNKFTQFSFITTVTISLVASYNTNTNYYQFKNTKEFNRYYLLLSMLYFYAWYIIIFYLK